MGYFRCRISHKSAIVPTQPDDCLLLDSVGGLLPLKHQQTEKATVKDPHSIFHSRDKKKNQNSSLEKDSVIQLTISEHHPHDSETWMHSPHDCAFALMHTLPSTGKKERKKTHVLTTTTKLYLHEFTNRKKL